MPISARSPSIARAPALAILLASFLLLMPTGAALARTVSLSATPASQIDTTVNVSGIFGSDSDGPKTGLVTGTAEATFTTALDPTFGDVATTLQITAADLAIGDVSFSLFVTIPIDISITGAAFTFTPEVLSPGVAIAAGTSELDLLPVSLLYTAGETVVVGSPIPLDDTYLDLMGQATVTLVPNGGLLDVTVTIPIQDTTIVDQSGITVEYVTDGVVVLAGTTTLGEPVPALATGPQACLALGVLATGYGFVAAGRRRRSTDRS